MKKQYIQNPNDPTQVIDTSILPPTINPQDLENSLADLKSNRDTLDISIANVQAQLDVIYSQVPEVKPLADNNLHSDSSFIE